MMQFTWSVHVNMRVITLSSCVMMILNLRCRIGLEITHKVWRQVRIIVMKMKKSVLLVRFGKMKPDHILLDIETV